MGTPQILPGVKGYPFVLITNYFAKIKVIIYSLITFCAGCIFQIGLLIIININEYE